MADSSRRLGLVLSVVDGFVFGGRDVAEAVCRRWWLNQSIHSAVASSTLPRSVWAAFGQVGDCLA